MKSSTKELLTFIQKTEHDKVQPSEKSYTFIRIHEISGSVADQMAFLWKTEYPDYFSYDEEFKFDIHRSRLISPVNYLALNHHKEVVGWLTTFERQGARWFSMIVGSGNKKMGLGGQLLTLAKQDETELNGWVVDHDRDKKADGSPYLSPLKFYVKNGFDILTDIRMETKELSVVKIRWRQNEGDKS